MIELFMVVFLEKLRPDKSLIKSHGLLVLTEEPKEVSA